MSRIVVGYDFSSGSACAIELAIDVANCWRSDIRLVYVKAKGEEESAIRGRMEERVASVRPLLKGVQLDYVVLEGDPADQLVSQSEADGAQLLVVGTHGMSGLKKGMLGRNSFKTIEESPIPVLVVREDFNFKKPLEHIVVPIDSSEDTRQKVVMASNFAKTFGATIHLVGLYTSTVKDVRRIVDGYVNMVSRYLDKAGVRYQTERLEVKKNVTLTTLDYANGIQADLIAIMTEQESNFGSLIKGTYSQQMLNLSKIPVLSVRPIKVVTDTANY